MQITFPHMGDMVVAVKALFQELGFTVVPLRQSAGKP